MTTSSDERTGSKLLFSSLGDKGKNFIRRIALWETDGCRLWNFTLHFSHPCIFIILNLLRTFSEQNNFYYLDYIFDTVFNKHS